MDSAVLQRWSSSAVTDILMLGLVFILEEPLEPESEDLE